MKAENSDALTNAINILIENIKQYECDFWSSPEQGVTDQEARDAAAKLIHEWFFDKEGDSQKIDGGMIESVILSVRRYPYSFWFVDTGNCRVYYSGNDSDNTYCLQDEGNEGIHFYVCTESREPLHRIKVPALELPENPDGDKWLQKMIDWIQSN